MLVNKEKSFASPACSSCGSADSMDIIFWVIWRIILDNPINIREVEASLSHVSAQQNSFLSLGKFEISCGPLLLFLLTVDVLHRYVDVVQQVAVELNSVTT